MTGVAAGLMQGWIGAFAERMQGRHLWAFGECICVNNVITPISLPLFSLIRSTVPLSRNRSSATRTIGGKYKDKVLYRGIGGVQEEFKEAYNNGGIF